MVRTQRVREHDDGRVRYVPLRARSPHVVVNGVAQLDEAHLSAPEPDESPLSAIYRYCSATALASTTALPKRSCNILARSSARSPWASRVTAERAGKSHARRAGPRMTDWAAPTASVLALRAAGGALPQIARIPRAQGEARIRLTQRAATSGTSVEA